MLYSEAIQFLYDLRLFGTYPKRELVVQYKETDLAFVSRLAEHVGISFTFDHGEGHITFCNQLGEAGCGLCHAVQPGSEFTDLEFLYTELRLYTHVVLGKYACDL